MRIYELPTGRLLDMDAIVAMDINDLAVVVRFGAGGAMDLTLLPEESEHLKNAWQDGADWERWAGAEYRERRRVVTDEQLEAAFAHLTSKKNLRSDP